MIMDLNGNAFGCQYEVFNQVNHCVIFTMSDIKGCIFLKLWGIFCYCGSTREYIVREHLSFSLTKGINRPGTLHLFFLLGDPTGSIYNSLSAADVTGMTFSLW